MRSGDVGVLGVINSSLTPRRTGDAASFWTIINSLMPVRFGEAVIPGEPSILLTPAKTKLFRLFLPDVVKGDTNISPGPSGVLGREESGDWASDMGVEERRDFGGVFCTGVWKRASTPVKLMLPATTAL